MSNWTNSSPTDLISYWKEFRESIENLPLDEQLSRVAHFFASVPIGPRSIDYYTPSSWPTPWEIFFDGTYCKSSISILMYDTLQIINNSPDIQLWLINDEQDTYLVPVVNNTHILNHILGEISNINDINSLYQITVLDRFQVIRKY